jgi:hypothetical protein
LRTPKTPAFAVVIVAALLALASRGDGAEASAGKSLALAQAGLDRALAVGSETVVPKPALAGATAGEVFAVHDPRTLDTIYDLVTIRATGGAIVGLIGVDASAQRILWYRFNYDHAAFPQVSSEAARARIAARARLLGEDMTAAAPILVSGFDKHFYWRFETPAGQAVFVDVERPDAAAARTADGSANGIVTPQAPWIEAAPAMQSEMPAAPGARQDRPADYNMPGIPYHYQINDYNCGPAALQMTMDYHGEEIGQAAIASVANTLVGPGTYLDDLRRAAHFSGMSAAVQDPLLRGYADRKLGYAAAENYWGYLPQAERYDDLKALICDGYPILILTWFDSGHGSGHFRVVKGYDDNLGVFVVDDPWYYGFSGPDLLVDQTYLVDNLWAYSYWWGMVSGPWVLHPEVPTSVALGDTFRVSLAVRYPGPYPFAGDFPCSACRASISLPAGMALAGGTPTVTLAALDSGDSTTVTWDVIAVGPVGERAIAFQAQGTVSSSSGAYPAYSDSVGGHSYETVEITPNLVAAWQPEERLTDDAGSSQTAWPGSRAMVLGDDGAAHLVWADTRDGNSEIYYRARSAGVWGAETRLTSDSGFSDGACITRGPDGRLHVAWVDTRDGNMEIYYKYFDPSAGWSADERVTSYSEADQSPTIAAGPAGVYLAWQRRETNGGMHYYYVMFSMRTGAGWSAPVDVDASPERDSYRPSLACGADGRVHLVYERQSANLPNEKERIVYRSWNGTTWSARTSLSTDLSYSRTPVIAAASDGKLHVVWQDGENIGGDIFYVMHNGTAWQPVEEIVAGSNEASAPSLAAGGDGSVNVTWVDNRHGESEIYFMRKDGAGWSGEARLSRAAGESMLPTVAANLYGDPCVAWTDLRHGNAEIYFRASGAVSGVPEVAKDSPRESLVSLGAPYPVPSHADTRLAFTVRASAEVAVHVFDVRGHLIAALAGGTYAPGTYGLLWNGRDARGARVSSGIYFVRCEALGEAATRTIMLVR